METVGDMKKKPLGYFQDEDVRAFFLPNGMSLNMVNGFLKKQQKFDFGIVPGQIEFCFFKQAHMEFSFLDDDSDFSATTMQSHLVVNKNKRGEVIYFTDCPYQEITIRLPLPVFEQMFCFSSKARAENQLMGLLKSENFFCHNSTMTPQMYGAFNALFLCPFDRDEHILYAQAKCMELIALKLMEIEKPLRTPFRNANTREEVIAGKTASILLENMAHPPSLQELADRVGVSPSRLKQIFPKIYGTSPFGFLRHHRLEYARDLIAHSGFSASEAALHVGYSELSPFHRAFVKEFGISPGQCRANPV